MLSIAILFLGEVIVCVLEKESTCMKFKIMNMVLLCAFMYSLSYAAESNEILSNDVVRALMENNTGTPTETERLALREWLMYQVGVERPLFRDKAEQWMSEPAKEHRKLRGQVVEFIVRGDGSDIDLQGLGTIFYDAEAETDRAWREYFFGKEYTFSNQTILENMNLASSPDTPAGRPKKADQVQPPQRHALIQWASEHPVYTVLATVGVAAELVHVWARRGNVRHMVQDWRHVTRRVLNLLPRGTNLQRLG